MGATACCTASRLSDRYRDYETIYMHPVILAYLARDLVHGSLAGAREGCRTIRAELAEEAPAVRGRRRAQGPPDRWQPPGCHRPGRGPRGAGTARPGNGTQTVSQPSDSLSKRQFGLSSRW